MIPIRAEELLTEKVRHHEHKSRYTDGLIKEYKEKIKQLEEESLRHLHLADELQQILDEIRK